MTRPADLSHDTVVVLVPVYKQRMEPYEVFSLRRCVGVLGRYPIAFLAPNSLDAEAYLAVAPGAHVLRFDDDYFVSTESYSELMLSERFYESMLHYEHVLIHQLDAFVFADRLQTWCAAGYDYIGAPWPRLKFRVGNGGFSLRRPAACLEVLRSPLHEDARTYWEVTYAHESLRVRASNYHKKLVKMLHIGTGVRSLIRRKPMEDGFWGVDARRYWPPFKVAPFEVAIMFAFEEGLRDLYHHYDERAPFGCHGKFNINAAYRLLHEGAEPESIQEQCFAHVLRRLREPSPG
jgi:hypothetical protein